MKRSWFWFVALVLVIVSLCNVAVAENWVFCNSCGAEHEPGGPCYEWNSEASSNDAEEPEVIWEETTEVVNWEEADEEPEAVEQSEMSYGKALLNRAAACNHEWQTFTSPMGVEGNMQIFYNQNYCPKCTLRGEFWESSEPVEVSLPDFGSQESTNVIEIQEIQEPQKVQESQEQNINMKDFFGILGTIILLVVAAVVIYVVYKACSKKARRRVQRVAPPELFAVYEDESEDDSEDEVEVEESADEPQEVEELCPDMVYDPYDQEYYPVDPE